MRGLFHREYEETNAVKDISFHVEAGEFVGFLGPNGAGKTTTLKILSGLLHPSGGSVSVLGYTPWERPIAYRRQFALLLGQKNQLWWDLPARESLELNGRIYRIPHHELERRVTELCQLLEVQEKLDVMVRELSLGERMKFELVAALLHRPRVLFLDEPTLGLDVVAQRAVRDFLRYYNETFGTTVLLTSHYMSDIEALCRRVIIIDQGRLFFDGSLEDVMDQFADSKLVTVQLAEHPLPTAAELETFGELLECGRGRIKIQVPRSRVLPVCRVLLERFSVNDIAIADISIEEVLRNLFTRSDRVQYKQDRAFEPVLVAA